MAVFNDYSDEVLEAFDEACLRALERCGLQAEGYAKDLCPVDTGALRNSISHKVDVARARRIHRDEYFVCWLPRIWHWTICHHRRRHAKKQLGLQGR